jgi:hypothetical protein
MTEDMDLNRSCRPIPQAIDFEAYRRLAEQERRKAAQHFWSSLWAALHVAPAHHGRRLDAARLG